MRDRIGSSELYCEVDDSVYKVVSHCRRFPSGAQKTYTYMNTPALGLDMSLPAFSAALWFDVRHVVRATFDNNPAGFKQLQRWLKKHCVGPSLRVGVESTNTYADQVVEWLHGQGYAVYLLNPERTACYARCLGQRNKTDSADAVTIAAYVAQHECTRWQPPLPEQKTLRELTRTRHELTATATQLRNQLRTAGPAGRPALQAVLDSVLKEIAGLERQMHAHVKASPWIAEAVRRIRTIKGIAFVTAAILVAELPPIDEHSDPRSICGWAGLTPRRWQSGHTEWRSRLSRKGNAYVRNALYMPALVAKRHNPVLRAFATRLAQAGKSPGSILGAVAHKMLRIVVGLLRSKTDFDPNWSFQET